MAKHRPLTENKPDRYITRREAAHQLGITRLELWNRTRRGEIRGYRLGGCIYYKLIDVENLPEE
ncbi:hypothetical protein ACS5NO_07845 [Larkinella sp. GY13]|uniref:hypothetical protein n=1 Tax=Larkinella sp. GY13 TaxID=3453720 RepID=UPI003EEFCA31